MASVDLHTLPRPPRNGPDWRERAIRIGKMVPGLDEHLSSIPIGWFSVIEHAAGIIGPLLVGAERVRTNQTKEKFGSLRWYASVYTPQDECEHDHAAIGVTDWAESVSEHVCCLAGTADGEMDATGGWWLTLSPWARRLRLESSKSPRGAHDPMPPLYPGWAQF